VLRETQLRFPLFDEGSPGGTHKVAAQIFARALTEEYRQARLADNKFA
jgi:hypothetical protein